MNQVVQLEDRKRSDAGSDCSCNVANTTLSMSRDVFEHHPNVTDVDTPTLNESRKFPDARDVRFISHVEPESGPAEISLAIERLRAQSVACVYTASSSSSTISDALIGLPSCFQNRKFRRVLKTILFGQLMSFCLCITGLTSQMLANKQYNAPAAQNFLNYFFLAFVYGAILLLRRSESRSFVAVLQQRGWKYLILAFIDVEANYLIVYAYQYTNITSIQLLNCFTIPVVMLLSWVFLSVRYMVSHISGVAICLIGVAVVISNEAYGSSGLQGGNNKLLGDLLCLCATTLYGTSNVCEEFFIKQNDQSEYLGMVGLFGFFISGMQLVIFESDRLASFNWNLSVIGYYLLFNASMFLFYLFVSVVMKRTSALMFNLSVLTASFYSLLTGVFFMQNRFQIPYLLSFFVVLFGLSIYSLQETLTTNEGDRECLCRCVNCCCPWAALCCGDCRPPKTAYTVQDMQAERSISSAADVRSESDSSTLSNYS